MISTKVTAGINAGWNEGRFIGATLSKNENNIILKFRVKGEIVTYLLSNPPTRKELLNFLRAYGINHLEQGETIEFPEVGEEIPQMYREPIAVFIKAKGEYLNVTKFDMLNAHPELQIQSSGNSGNAPQELFE